MPTFSKEALRPDSITILNVCSGLITCDLLAPLQLSLIGKLFFPVSRYVFGEHYNKLTTSFVLKSIWIIKVRKVVLFTTFSGNKTPLIQLAIVVATVTFQSMHKFPVELGSLYLMFQIGAFPRNNNYRYR